MQSTRALLCLGSWSRLGLVRISDVKVGVSYPELEGEEDDGDVEDGWDKMDFEDL